MRKTHHLTVKDLTLMALFAALVAVCSQIQIPTPVAPVNLALFAVYLAGALLGRRRGTISLLVYLLLAAIGVPVMAGFAGGLGVLLGKTGGYAIGYLLAAWCAGFAAERWENRMLPLAAGMTVGCLLCYLFGTLWYMHLSRQSFMACLGWCVVPFLPGDAVKIALAALLAGKLRAILKKQNLI